MHSMRPTRSDRTLCIAVLLNLPCDTEATKDSCHRGYVQWVASGVQGGDRRDWVRLGRDGCVGGYLGNTEPTRYYKAGPILHK